MKTMLLCLAIFAGLFLAGCSGLIAKSDAGKAIQADVLTMNARVASTQPVTDLAANAARFDFYYSTATVNVFAWLFGPKQLLVSPTIYGDLQGKAARSDDYATAMKSSTQPSTRPVYTNPNLWLSSESTWMQNIERERAGK